MTAPKYDTVVITGANRGIGLEFSRHFAPHCQRLLACCREPDEADALRHLADTQDAVEIQRLEVTRAEDIQSLKRTVADRPVDVLINNAGVYGPSHTGLDVDPQAWLEVFEVNTIAPVKMADALLDNLLASQRKIIANITSKMGSIGDNSSGGAYIYRSSKAALNATMRSVAQDTADRGLTVLLLHPGWVKTDMGGDNALIEPETSVKGMKEIIDGASPQLSGRFLSYDGNEIPW